MSLTVLITGFGPFPGAPFNPTQSLVPTLAKMRRPAFADVQRVGHVFATRYDAVDRELPALLRTHRPDVVLLWGLAARTPYLRIERHARNRRSSTLPDAGGALPSRRVIDTRAAAALTGRAPFIQALRAARSTRIPARLSRDAGRYLCNYVYWRALEQSAAPLVLFVHVPKVLRVPRRRGRSRKVTAREWVRAGEAVLRVLIAAARR
jgi:pyroglutamyl-peptidase